MELLVRSSLPVLVMERDLRRRVFSPPTATRAEPPGRVRAARRSGELIWRATEGWTVRERLEAAPLGDQRAVAVPPLSRVREAAAAVEAPETMRRLVGMSSAAPGRVKPARRMPGRENV